jgi:hypothetical protein
MVAPALAAQESKSQPETVEGKAVLAAPTDKQQVEAGTPESPQPVEGSDKDQVTEQKIEGKDEGEGGEKPADELKPKAPESYELSTKVEGLPEGQELDKTTIEKWSALARELDLDNDQAQGVLKTVVPEMVRQFQEQQAKTHTEWVEAQHADKEVGGENRKPAIALAQKVLADERLATPALRELFNGPLGDHPELLRFVSRVGKAMSEDRIVHEGAGGDGANGDSEVAMRRKLYPNSPQN